MANQKQSSEQINKVNVIKSYLVDEVWTLQEIGSQVTDTFDEISEPDFEVVVIQHGHD
jgi:hypothetical protein